MLKPCQASQFCVGDKVNIVGSDGSLEGPFLVAFVCSGRQKCTLSFEDGQAAKSGEEIEFDRLVAA
jgi:hypothetical protein